mmetsp:Transcript_21053/g.33041  ORF Transcript_21053/g.33041 Transcript_21053/m.33041 type:complete len:111 (-) Transcript_21053:207-539(-)
MRGERWRSMVAAACANPAAKPTEYSSLRGRIDGDRYAIGSTSLLFGGGGGLSGGGLGGLGRLGGAVWDGGAWKCTSGAADMVGGALRCDALRCDALLSEGDIVVESWSWS